jgi:membrane glycosyltransferase
MQALPETLSIAQEIQLSVAPVFMLTAIAALLALLFNRMSQTQDQIRALGELPEGEGTMAKPDKAASRVLAARVSRIQWAIRCNVTAAILICAVVVSIFISDYLVPRPLQSDRRPVHCRHGLARRRVHSASARCFQALN